MVILADMSVAGISAFSRTMSQSPRLRETLANAAKTGKMRSFFPVSGLPGGILGAPPYVA